MYRALSWYIDCPRDSSIDWNIDNAWSTGEGINSGQWWVQDSLSITKMPYTCDITSCHRYLYNSHLMFYCYCVLVLTALSDIPQMYSTCSRLFKGIYVAVPIFVIHKMHVAWPLCDDGNFNDLDLHLGALGDWEIPKKLYFCEQFSSEFRGIFMEYILKYIAVTVVFSVRNRKEKKLSDGKS